MELYSGPNMVNEKYLKTKYLRSKNRDSTVFGGDLFLSGCNSAIVILHLAKY
jgi:hypothetical protein